MGLGVFPSSVMAKSPSLARLGGVLTPAESGMADGRSGVQLLVDSVMEKARNSRTAAFVVFVAVALVFGFPRTREGRALWAVLAFGLLCHLVVGMVGWFQRYHVYLFAGGTVLLVALRRERPLVPLPRWLAVPAIVLYFVVIGAQSLRTLQTTSRGSACVYLQQHQMMRFVRDFYRAPVAVNDLGEVAFGSGQYVLDLWGLASRDALRARLSSGPGVVWEGPVVDRHHIGLVMIYPQWFPDRPKSWQFVGRLKLNITKTAVGEDSVSFYVTSHGDASAVRRELERFRSTLPPGASFETDAPREDAG